MKNLFKKIMLLALVAALAAASLPLVSVSAAGADDPNPPQGPVTNEKLEQIWARQQLAYERIGRGFDRADQLTERIQNLIERAKANGRDISAVQSALDAFEAALKQAHPLYEGGKGILNSHQGFDANGRVTDPDKAKETVRAMHEKLQAIRDAMNGTGKALHEAIREFREANPRPVKTPAP